MTKIVRRPLGVRIMVILAAFRGVIGLWASIAVVGVLKSFGADDFSLLNVTWLAAAGMFLVFACGAWTIQPWAWPSVLG